jgi:hypothetical protein
MRSVQAEGVADVAVKLKTPSSNPSSTVKEKKISKK